MDYEKDFPALLKALRKEIGKTQKGIAAEIGINERVYQRYELGENAPGYAMIPRLADALGVSINALYGRENK